MKDSFGKWLLHQRIDIDWLGVLFILGSLMAILGFSIGIILGIVLNPLYFLLLLLFPIGIIMVLYAMYREQRNR